MRNLLMDADAMYPEGFHPVDNDYKRDFSDWATYSPRSAVGVRYYFADFGISVHMPKGGTVTGILGRDREPPELSSTIPQAYDPFKLDVFITGNMLKQEFCNVIILLSVTSRKSHTPLEIHQRRLPSTARSVDDSHGPRAKAHRRRGAKEVARNPGNDLRDQQGVASTPTRRGHSGSSV